MSENQKLNGEEPEQEMSFLDHLEQLRWHLIRSSIAIVTLGVLAFINKHFVFDKVILGPKNSEFLTFKFLCKASSKLNEWLPNVVGPKTLCIGQNMPELQNINMAGQFTSHIMTSIVVGLIVAFPYVFWEVWRFVAPGLKEGEKNNARGAVLIVSLLFFVGVLFGYFVICPLSVNFFLTYSVSETVQNLPTLGTYISTVTTVVLACGFVFQLPVVVMVLTKLGIVSPLVLRKFRKHAFVGSLVLSAIITPPDVFSQFLVTLPLMVLYEISIFISARITKKAT